MSTVFPLPARALFLLLLLAAACAHADGDDQAWIAEAYHRSLAYERTQRYDQAIKALALVEKAYPKGYTVNLRLGWLNYLAGRHANAIAHYHKAQHILPDALEPKLGLALPLLAQQRFAEAETVLVQVLRIDLYNYPGNLRLLQALAGQGKYEAARAVARRMLARYPADVAFLAWLGRIEAKQGEEEKARRLFRDVLILDPENVAARAFFRALGERKKR